MSKIFPVFIPVYKGIFGKAMLPPLSTTLLIAACAALAGCSRTQGSASAEGYRSVLKDDSIPVAVKELVKSVVEGDSIAFARLVSYPLERPYPLDDIKDEDDMLAHYSGIVDDSLRNVMAKSSAASWGEYGWRGWSVDGGEYVWLDDRVYDIPYLSAREAHLRDSLLEMEKAAMNPEIRKGWTPVNCYKGRNDGNVYRIDRKNTEGENGTDTFRLAVYGPGSDLRGMPHLLEEGFCVREGTAQSGIYHFPLKEGGEYIIEPYPADTDTPLIYLPAGEEEELAPVHWYELTRPEN